MSCVLRLHFGLMIRRLTTLTSAGRPTEGLFRVRTSGRAIRRARAKKALTSFCYYYNTLLICNYNIIQQLSYKIEVRSTYARSDRSIRAFYGQDVFLFQALIG